MNERDRILLNDMLDAAHKIQVYVAGKERVDLEKDDELLGFAVIRALEVIGEAANGISQQTQLLSPSVQWRDIVGMRNRLIHGYRYAPKTVCMCRKRPCC